MYVLVVYKRRLYTRVSSSSSRERLYFRRDVFVVMRFENAGRKIATQMFGQQ